MTLLDKIKAAIPVGLLVTAVMAVIGMYIMAAQRDEARAALRAEKAISADLAEKLMEQNEAVDKLEKAAKQNRDIYIAGLQAANRKAIRLEIDAEEILKLPSPETPDEQCEAARELLVGE